MLTVAFSVALAPLPGMVVSTDFKEEAATLQMPNYVLVDNVEIWSMINTWLDHRTSTIFMQMKCPKFGV